eukprot:CAMPEP_0201942362 /NCGR_PEP_ID=MMETSP0903-20130614/48886_1 /ASSEMBLY_ACC=CAM_ASM_000552 /TAXON_ID=420261 /ORGANISM="Thalassiosira antarctica, Strain CCMP982" /LENGTH=513 /DNA_ID=CAMNT_0048484723 /DNA_START=1 /DNA_END=1542 /DNA_ORIENTATION=+
MVSSNPRRKRKRAPLMTIISGCLAATFLTSFSDAFQPQHAHYLRNTPCRSNQLYPYQCKANRLNYSQEGTQLFTAKNNEEGSSDGSIAGASLLFAGTAIGAGMIALPAETVDAGFIPSVFGLLLCWVFTYVTSLVTLEASWLASTISSEKNDEGGGGAGFLSISRMALGIPGEILTASLFWFLLTAIIVAYTAEGGQLISQFLKEVVHTDIAPAIGSLVFATFFASVATYGTSRVDAINRIFVFGLIATFCCLVGVGLPMVNGSNLINQSDWGMVYPPVISIGILSFGAQNVVPTLLQYLNYDPLKTRQAILFGSLLPLILYTIWEAVFLGLIDTSTADGSKMEVVSVLGQVGGPVVTDLVEVFSLCAIGSSMAGASVSLVDFFQDAISILSKKEIPNQSQSLPLSEEGVLSGNIRTRILAAALALGPPVILSYAYPDIFLVALEEAGLLGGVSLYGILPAICILSLRRSSMEGANTQATMPGRLGGGDTILIALVAISSALVLPEIRDLLWQ